MAPLLSDIAAAKGQSVPVVLYSASGKYALEVAKAMLMTPVLGLFLCSLATLLSLVSESVRSAAQFTSLAMLGLFFLAPLYYIFLFSVALRRFSPTEAADVQILGKVVGVYRNLEGKRRG